MSEQDKFDGGGFKETPLEGKEAAQHRHMFHELNRNWIKIDPDTLETMKDAATIANAFQILSGIVKVGGPVGLAFLAIGAFAKSEGWL